VLRASHFHSRLRESFLTVVWFSEMAFYGPSLMSPCLGCREAAALFLWGPGGDRSHSSGSFSFSCNVMMIPGPFLSLRSPCFVLESFQLGPPGLDLTGCICRSARLDLFFLNGLSPLLPAAVHEFSGIVCKICVPPPFFSHLCTFFFPVSLSMSKPAPR